MSRQVLPLFIPLALLFALTSSSSPATSVGEAILRRPAGRHAAVGVKVADAPSVAGCSRSEAAASRVVEESCTDDIVGSFFGVSGREVCCRALEAVGAGCYRAVFSGSPFADVYPTILANVCGLGLVAAPAPTPGARESDRAAPDLLL